MKIIRHNCGKNKFDMKDILLNTMTIFSLGFDRAQASAIISLFYSRIEWNFNRPELIDK
ncbi:MAG: hypothetical protein AB1432_09655 [Bacteroidota bacterium]